MRKVPSIASDEVVTSYELEYAQREVVRVMGELLVGRRLFADGINGGGFDGGPGKQYYTYYTENDGDTALVSMTGTTQANSKAMREEHRVKIVAITQTFRIEWREWETAKSEGTDLLAFEAQSAARKVAETEDEIMVSGEHTGFLAHGVEGLATRTGRNTQAGGNWGTAGTGLSDILAGWALMQDDGFHDSPVLVAGPALIKCLMNELSVGAGISELQYLLNNGIISGWMKTSNLFTGATQDTTALLVQPDANHMYYVEGQGPELKVTVDKDGNIYGLLRETITPIMGRPEAICELTGLSCT